MDHELGTYGMAIDYCIMKEGMSILRGRKSVPGISSSESEMERKEPMAWQTNYCIMKEGISILRGRKSIPGVNSSEREMERMYYSAFT
nr:hypothetical protein [Tanacetum cinerariifolium]